MLKSTLHHIQQKSLSHLYPNSSTSTQTTKNLDVTKSDEAKNVSRFARNFCNYFEKTYNFSIERNHESIFKIKDKVSSFVRNNISYSDLYDTFSYTISDYSYNLNTLGISNVEEVAFFLEIGMIASTDTLFNSIAREKSPQLIRLLLDEGALPTTEILNKAVVQANYRSFNTIQALLKAGAQAESYTIELALQTRHPTKTIKMLVEANPTTNSYLENALELALTHHHPFETIKLLVENGADFPKFFLGLALEKRHSLDTIVLLVEESNQILEDDSDSEIEIYDSSEAIETSEFPEQPFSLEELNPHAINLALTNGHSLETIRYLTETLGFEASDGDIITALESRKEDPFILEIVDNLFTHFDDREHAHSTEVVKVAFETESNAVLPYLYKKGFPSSPEAMLAALDHKYDDPTIKTLLDVYIKQIKETPDFDKRRVSLAPVLTKAIEMNRSTELVESLLNAGAESSSEQLHKSLLSIKSHETIALLLKDLLKHEQPNLDALLNNAVHHPCNAQVLQIFFDAGAKASQETLKTFFNRNYFYRSQVSIYHEALALILKNVKPAEEILNLALNKLSYDESSFHMILLLVNAEAQPSLETLNIALKRGFPFTPIVQTMLDKVDKSSYESIMLAVEQKYEGQYEGQHYTALINKGALATASEEEKTAIIDKAVIRNHRENLYPLINLQPLFDAGVKPGTNTLSIAIKSGYPIEDIDLLIEKGALPTIETLKTTLDQFPIRKDIVEYLKEKKVFVTPDMIDKAVVECTKTTEQSYALLGYLLTQGTTPKSETLTKAIKEGYTIQVIHQFIQANTPIIPSHLSDAIRRYNSFDLIKAFTEKTPVASMHKQAILIKGAEFEKGSYWHGYDGDHHKIKKLILGEN